MRHETAVAELADRNGDVGMDVLQIDDQFAPRTRCRYRPIRHSRGDRSDHHDVGPSRPDCRPQGSGQESHVIHEPAGQEAFREAGVSNAADADAVADFRPGPTEWGGGRVVVRLAGKHGHVEGGSEVLAQLGQQLARGLSVRPIGSVQEENRRAARSGWGGHAALASGYQPAAVRGRRPRDQRACR